MADLISQLNEYLSETEALAQEFLPLRETLAPIQSDFHTALNTLSKKAKEAEDPADKVFFINRYADLVKKVEGIFDTRSKRLQQSISMIAKLPDPVKNPEEFSDSAEDESEDRITPEQANAILKIISTPRSRKKESNED